MWSDRSKTEQVAYALVHLYVSTACQHELHGQCRETCKFCEAACLCPCHEAPTPSGFDPAEWRLNQE